MLSFGSTRPNYIRPARTFGTIPNIVTVPIGNPGNPRAGGLNGMRTRMARSAAQVERQRSMGARQRLLQVLVDGPLCVDELLRRACPDVPRRLALNSVHRLVAAGLVVISEMPNRTSIAPFGGP